MRLSRAFAIVMLASVSAFAAMPFKEYLERLDRAASIMSALFDDHRETPRDQEIVSALASVEALVPSKNEVIFGDAAVRIDNMELIKAIGHLRNRYRLREGSDADRHDELIELAGRVILLSQRVDAVLQEPALVAQDQRERLRAILARPEYQPQINQESRLKKWINRAWAAFLRLLNRLVDTEAAQAPPPGRASLDVVRALISIGLLIALVFGSYYLVRRVRRRRRNRKERESKADVRELLGEQIAADMTTQELLARAADLARQGDFRSAIRRAFVALLFDLEGRGKVRLDPAKTNHDYVNEVRTDETLREPVTSMTSAFERVWYGQQCASNEEYANFLKSWPRTEEGGTAR